MHKQGQSKGQGRRQTERISKGRQGQKTGSKRSELYKQSGYKQGKHTQGKRSEMSDGAKQDTVSRHSTHRTIQEGVGAEVESGEETEVQVHVGQMRPEPTRAEQARLEPTRAKQTRQELVYSLDACLHVVMSCVNTWLMSFLISCVFMSCFAHGW